MTRAIALSLAILLGGFALGMAQIPTPEDTGAITFFVEDLKECVEIESWYKQGTGVDFKIPAGRYCKYYRTDLPDFLYDVGYFGSLGSACGPLHRLLEGQHWDCHYEPRYPHWLLPPDPALLVEISGKHDQCDLWINGDWEQLPQVGPPGFHTSVGSLNWDGQYHAFCYVVEYEKVTCECRCLKTSTGISTQPGKGYLIFWDAGCPLSGYDWNDFWVALFPAE